MRGQLLFFFLLLIGYRMSAQTTFPDTIRWSADFSSQQAAAGWMNLDQRQALPNGDIVLVTDSTHPYGAGYSWTWPDSLPSRSVLLHCEAKLRSSTLNPGIQWVLSIEEQGQTLLWDGRDLNNQLNKQDEFVNTNVGFKVPANFLRRGTTIKVYLYQPDRRSRVETSGVTFSLCRWGLPSFLPPGSPQSDSRSAEQELFLGTDYAVRIQPAGGILRVDRPDGQRLIRNVLLYTEAKGDSITPRFSTLEFQSDSVAQGVHYLLFRSANERFNTTITLATDEKAAAIRWSLNTEWLQPTELVRQAIVMLVQPAASQAVDVVGRMLRAGDDEESWLGRGAVSYGDSLPEIIVSYPDQLSSLQLDWASNTLWLNADWSMDHPLLHWPKEKKSRNYRLDRSCSVYRVHERLEARWETYFRMPSFFPALQDRPFGYDATFIWTEHADYSDLKLQRAVMFGHDSISDPSTAKKGFVARGIPMTKSVFYNNPDRVTNRKRHAAFPGAIATMRETPGFEALMQTLEESGSEIALHTPEQFTSNRKQLDIALQYMRSRFNTTTWIDHGYDNAPSSNREDLVCDGLDSLSDGYALDTWLRYGITSVWNCFYEDTNVFLPYSFDSRLDAPYSGISGRFPAPIWWTHPTRSKSILHWRTTTTLDPTDGSMWSYYLGEQRLDDLVRRRGTYIAHCYPARVDSTNGFYSLNGGHWEIEPAFDDALALQARYREEHKLWLPVVREYLSYQQRIREVKMVPTEDGWRYSNSGHQPVQGFTLYSEHLLDSGSKAMQIRSSGSGHYYSFDLDPGETVFIKLK